MDKKNNHECWKAFDRNNFKRSSNFEVWDFNEVRKRGEKFLYTAPDGSKITRFQDVRYGGLCHASFVPKSVSMAHFHPDVDEIWYCLSGNGQIGTAKGKSKKISKIKPGDSISIPRETSFQVKNISKKNSLDFIVATMPPWPGPSGAKKGTVVFPDKVTQ